MWRIEQVRYLTIAQYDNTVTAHVESSDFKNELENAADWVWQYAPDEQTAIANHNIKHDEYCADVTAGKEPKHTY